jgi:acetyl esterase/lipase
MPSTQSDALRALYQSMSDRMAANPDMDLVTMRSMLEEVAALTSEPENVTYAEVHSDGVRGLWCRPAEAQTDRAVIYFHGGGFALNSVGSHRKMAAHLGKAAGVPVFLVDYRLAPEHPFPAQIDDAVSAYHWLVQQGYDASRLATAGDSAGGNLATSTVLKLRELGETLPAAIIGFSPWLDMECLGKTIETNAASDALITRELVATISQMYLGADGSPTDPLANPLHADLAGLPPIFVTAGEAETLLSDSERLAEQATAAGVDVEFSTVAGQQHVFPFMAGRAPEADQAIAAAASWLRPLLGLS